MLVVLWYSVSNFCTVEIPSYFKVASRKVYLKLVLDFKLVELENFIWRDVRSVCF